MPGASTAWQPCSVYFSTYFMSSVREPDLDSGSLDSCLRVFVFDCRAEVPSLLALASVLCPLLCLVLRCVLRGGLRELDSRGSERGMAECRGKRSSAECETPPRLSLNAHRFTQHCLVDTQVVH